MSDQPLVSASDLSVHYDGSDDWVLDELSFTHLDGMVTAVVGPSGCGKSTLIRTIAGLIPHSMPSEYAGSLILRDVEIADASISHLATTLAYVGQSPDASVVTQKVIDEVTFPLQNLQLSRTEITQRATHALESVGLTHVADVNPWSLSGGQRQRLSLAVALAMHPELLVLDEPTSTIDQQATDEFYAHLEKLVTGGLSVIVIDHDLDPLLHLIDQVIALDGSGALIAAGSPADVFVAHRERLVSEGIWLPRAVRAGHGVLTCEQAGIHVPQLADFCGKDVRYWQKTTDGWHAVPALFGDQHLPATVELSDFSVPGRSPSISARFTGGELVALVGGNGSGKTSLLAALAGITQSVAAESMIEGRPVKRGHHHAGFVFQNPEQQFVRQTVAQEVSLGGTPAAKVTQLLEQFHLTNHAERHPLTLSGGQARRLSVATMASVSKPIALLDEPTFGQDWAQTHELMQFIDQLRGDGSTVIMATHDMDIATEWASHIIALPPGTHIPEPKPIHAQQSWLARLNPVALFLAILVPLLSVLVIRDVTWNLWIMGLASVLTLLSGAGWKRILTVLAMSWGLCGALAASMAWWVSTDLLTYHPGYMILSPLLLGSTIGALIALVMVSGVGTSPEAILRTCTQRFKLPVRVSVAGVASLAFLERFQADFRTLRTARALRGVGDRWGVLAPAVRWVSAIVPFLISALSHSERVALSMDTRGLGAYRTRTEMLDAPWRLMDWIVVFGTWAVCAAAWAATVL